MSAKVRNAAISFIVRSLIDLAVPTSGMLNGRGGYPSVTPKALIDCYGAAAFTAVCHLAVSGAERPSSIW